MALSRDATPGAKVGGSAAEVFAATYPGIRVETVWFRVHRRGRFDLPVGVGRKVTLADGRVHDFNHWVRRRSAIERALL